MLSLAALQSGIWTLIVITGACAEPAPGMLACTPERQEITAGLDRAACEVALGVHLARPVGLVVAECTDGAESVGGIATAGVPIDLAEPVAQSGGTQ